MAVCTISHIQWPIQSDVTYTTVISTETDIFLHPTVDFFCEWTEFSETLLRYLTYCSLLDKGFYAASELRSMIGRKRTTIATVTPSATYMGPKTSGEEKGGYYALFYRG